MIVYKIGSTGDEIKAIQALLGIVEDGIYGQQTYNSVKQYQARYGLNVTGNIDEETLYHMRLSIQELSLNGLTTNKASVNQYLVYGIIGIIAAMFLSKK